MTESTDTPFIDFDDMAMAASLIHDTTQRILAAGNRLGFMEQVGAQYVLEHLTVGFATGDVMGIVAKTPGELPREFILHMNLNGVRHYPDLMPFVIAHEMKHGILHVQHASPLSSLYRSAQFWSGAIEHMFYDDQPCVRDTGVIGLFANAMQKITGLARIPSRAMSRYTENLCDDFALRVCPDVHLEDFERYLASYTRKDVSHIYDTHPPDAVRIDRLRRKQDRLLAHL